ncbi:MAG: hypothetical protein MJE66_09730 [Proteobacteria bacterium]|nr:hypothetical protein [Pseudomonadota bacterium]
MVVFGLASVGILFLVWNVVGVRLLLLARRTRGFPEFALGSSLLLVAGIGFPMSVFNGLVWDAGAGPATMVVLNSLHLFLQNAGLMLAAVFTWRVFRRHDTWALGLLGMIAIALVVHGVGMVAGMHAAGDRATFAETGAIWFCATLVLCGGVFGWAGLEALLYRRSLVKRLALGLASPEVVNRMFLWGVMGVASFTCGVVDVSLLAAGVRMEAGSVLLLVTSFFGLVDSACLYLAFLPPRRYLDWVHRQAAPVEA